MENNIRIERLKTKLQIQREKYLNLKNILKVILPVIFSLLILMGLGIYSVQASYASRIIKNDSDIPEELTSATIVLKLSDLKLTSGFWNDALQKSLDLYNARKIRDIYIFVLDDVNQVNFDINQINKYFKTLPESRYKVANLLNSVYDVCSELRSDYKVDKTLLIANRSLVTRVGFLCNSDNIFVNSLQVKSDFDDSPAGIRDTFSDILYIVLGQNEN